MAGIYIHIPYCKQACIYCDFHFSTVRKNKTQLLHCLKREMELRKSELQNEPIETIYFGGGTPSLLSAQELELILECIYANFYVAPECEITLEANPDDLLPQYINDLKRIGINRLSIGIQSFFEEDLLWMNRAHTSQQATHCIQNAQEAGITNISADLIFATPHLTWAKLAENLKILTSFSIPHISCYNLTVEEKTKLNHEINAKRMKVVEDEVATEQFYFIRNYLQEHGYEHYEISNYAKPGAYSRHNTAYWQRKKYLGIGPAAHSFNGIARSWNMANNEKYIKSFTEHELTRETEVLSANNRFNELLLTGLRTKWGIGYMGLQTEFPQQFASVSQRINAMIEEGKLELKGDSLIITPQFLVMADGLVSELFLI